MSKIRDINDIEFDKEIKKEGLTLIDFWAPWCGPCKIMGKILEEIAQEKGDKVRIFKIDIDKNPVMQRKFSIRGIPTIMLFKDGENVETQVGSISKSQIENLINNYV